MHLASSLSRPADLSTTWAKVGRGGRFAAEDVLELTGIYSGSFKPQRPHCGRWEHKVLVLHSQDFPRLSPSPAWFIWCFLWLNLSLKYGTHLLRHFSLQKKASMWASTPIVPIWNAGISSPTSWLYMSPSFYSSKHIIPLPASLACHASHLCLCCSL